MLAQSTSRFTEGARRTKRSKFTTTKATKASPATRNIAGGTRCGWKWLIHLPPTAGTASKSATISVRRRLATAKTAESKTRESRIDTMISPPLISSTNGKKKKSNARAISSWTIEKRRSPNALDDFSTTFIDHAFSRYLERRCASFRVESQRIRPERFLIESIYHSLGA